MYKITAVVEKACKDLGIPYVSPYHEELLEYQKDVNRLSEAVFRLKEIAGLLAELECKYDINDLQKVFRFDEEMLHQVEHHIVIEAQKILKGAKL